MRRERRQRRTDLLGEGFTWLCAGALALNLLLAISLILLIANYGLSYFWQKRLVRVVLVDGTELLGEVQERESTPVVGEGNAAPAGTRFRLKVGNRDLYGLDFRWVDEREVVTRDYPERAMVLERREWGNLYGNVVELRRDDQVIAAGHDEVLDVFPALHDAKMRELEAIRDLEHRDIGDINFEIEDVRLAEQRLAAEALSGEERTRRQAELDHRKAQNEAAYERLTEQLFAMRKRLLAEALVMGAVDGRRVNVQVGEIVRAIQPNAIGVWGRMKLYVARVWEFVADDPRESNTEGGIFPAIFGTVMMVFVMSFVLVPFGVLAALYLREYAKEGPVVRAVRIAVNNLAGVPSIVFGVFGLGFFVYLIGGTIDQVLYPEALPTPTFGTGGILWASLTLALLTLPVVIVATEEGLAAVPRVVREGSLALGVTKFETTCRVVVPAAAPAILTGMILAMARAAGEVAPLMIVGMVKLARTLPIDHHFPYVHLERKFMHLGFHIYDVGFQSPNVEATQPLVFATALLLIVVVLLMNLAAIIVRNRLRLKYSLSAV